MCNVGVSATWVCVQLQHASTCVRACACMCVCVRVCAYAGLFLRTRIQELPCTCTCAWQRRNRPCSHSSAVSLNWPRTGTGGSRMVWRSRKKTSAPQSCRCALRTYYLGQGASLVGIVRFNLSLGLHAQAPGRHGEEIGRDEKEQGSRPRAAPRETTPSVLREPRRQGPYLRY